MPPTVLRLYVAAVAAAAIAAVALLPAGSGSTDFGALALLVLLSVFAGARPVRFVGRGNEITATHAAILCALAILGPLPALLTAAAGIVASLIIRSGRPKLIRSVFNCAGVALSTAVAAHLFLACGGLPGDLGTMLPWPLLTATVAYFVVNTGLVSLAVAIERAVAFHRAWRRLHWTAASYFTGAILALGLVAAYDYQGPLGLALGLPPIWVLLNFYSVHHGKLKEKERHIGEVESLNRELRVKIGELQSALQEVRELRALLPICMHCKSIRDDDNTWHRIEAYISKHYDTEFTHALCDRCRETHYDAPSKAAVTTGDGD